MPWIANTCTNPNVIIWNTKEQTSYMAYSMYTIAYFVTRDHICCGEYSLTAYQPHK